MMNVIYIEFIFLHVFYCQILLLPNKLQIYKMQICHFFLSKFCLGLKSNSQSRRMNWCLINAWLKHHYRSFLKHLSDQDIVYQKRVFLHLVCFCLLYTSDAADDMQCVDLGGRRIIKKIFFKQKTAYEM